MSKRYLMSTFILWITCFYVSGQTDSPNQNLDSTDKIIHISVELTCSQQEAFDYFSENDLLIKWLTLKADVEMRVGGKYELFWTPNDPDKSNNSTYGCRILAVEQPHFFTTEWRGNINHKSFMNNVRPLTNVNIFFSKLEEHKTKVTLIHTGWRQGEDWEGARNDFVKAWEGAFQRLKTLAQKK